MLDINITFLNKTSAKTRTRKQGNANFLKIVIIFVNLFYSIRLLWDVFTDERVSLCIQHWTQNISHWNITYSINAHCNTVIWICSQVKTRWMAFERLIYPISDCGFASVHEGILMWPYKGPNKDWKMQGTDKWESAIRGVLSKNT